MDDYRQLRENEAAFRSLIENARHFAVYRVAFDPHDPYGGQLVFVSPSIVEIVGGDTGQDFASWFKNLHPDDSDRIVEANRRSIESGVPYNEICRVFHREKNRWVWLHTISNPCFDKDGRLIHFDGMVIDVTDQMNFREVDRLRQAAEGLREIFRIINSNRSFREILDFITQQANQLLQANSTMIRQIFPEEGVVRTIASHGLPGDFDPVWQVSWIPTENDRSLMRGQPVVIPDVRAAWEGEVGAADGGNAENNGPAATLRYYRTLLKVPLIVKDQFYGAITFNFEQACCFREEDLRLALTLGDQAALAIENARLIDRVKEQAVIEERGRLARELHDAVTQTLFSATLTAEVLPKIWERSPVAGRKKLEELRVLTGGALAEMRSLLMELRPDALADAELKDLLRHLTNAFIARTQIPVQLVLQGDFVLPSNVKIAFYRVAQEALNNIAKYSEAQQVVVALTYQESSLDGTVRLSVSDDGKGFDPDRQLSGVHMGLLIMRERARDVDAGLEISSRPGGGTSVKIYWTAAHPVTEE
jgi:two-component system nitrate/nitrite sensor histidine kinase NarX